MKNRKDKKSHFYQHFSFFLCRVLENPYFCIRFSRHSRNSQLSTLNSQLSMDPDSYPAESSDRHQFDNIKATE